MPYRTLATFMVFAEIVGVFSAVINPIYYKKFFDMIAVGSPSDEFVRTLAGILVTILLLFILLAG